MFGESFSEIDNFRDFEVINHCEDFEIVTNY